MLKTLRHRAEARRKSSIVMVTMLCSSAMYVIGHIVAHVVFN